MIEGYEHQKVIAMNVHTWSNLIALHSKYIPTITGAETPRTGWNEIEGAANSEKIRRRDVLPLRVRLRRTTENIDSTETHHLFILFEHSSSIGRRREFPRTPRFEIQCCSIIWTVGLSWNQRLLRAIGRHSHLHQYQYHHVTSDSNQGVLCLWIFVWQQLLELHVHWWSGRLTLLRIILWWSSDKGGWWRQAVFGLRVHWH